MHEITEHCYNTAECSGKLSVLLQRKANEVSPDILEDLILNEFLVQSTEESKMNLQACCW